MSESRQKHEYWPNRKKWPIFQILDPGSEVASSPIPALASFHFPCLLDRVTNRSPLAWEFPGLGTENAVPQESLQPQACWDSWSPYFLIKVMNVPNHKSIPVFCHKQLIAMLPWTFPQITSHKAKFYNKSFLILSYWDTLWSPWCALYSLKIGKHPNISSAGVFLVVFVSRMLTG